MCVEEGGGVGDVTNAALHIRGIAILGLRNRPDPKGPSRGCAPCLPYTALGILTGDNK